MIRSELRKQIFLTVKNQQNLLDTDEIKEARNAIALQQFNKIESELDETQLKSLLHFLRFGSSLCSKKQENSVRGYAFEFAIYYHDYENFKVINKVGEVMNPNDVKLMIQELYKNGSYRNIPAKYKKALVSETANPKCNNLLQIAGFRSTTKKSDVFYYDKMTPEEADYLIKRFMKILSEVKIQHPLGVNQISNN